MSKKKMTALICLVIFINFSVSTFLNFKSTRNNESMILSERYTHILDVFNTVLYNFDANFLKEEDYPAVIRGDCTYPQFVLSLLVKDFSAQVPYVIGLINTEQQIVAQRKSAVFVITHTTGENFESDIINYYIDIEHCLTEELKDKIAETMKTRWILQSIGVRIDENGRYEPTELIFSNKNDYYTDIAISLNNGETKTYINHSNQTYLKWDFYNVNERSYEKKYYSDLYTEMQLFAEKNHTFHSGGGFSDADESLCYSPVTINGEDYIFYFHAKSNLTMRTLDSDLFKYLQQQLIIMYAVITAIILFIALRLYSKKERLEKSKHTFISAAAHELKTPLAVIQNQCECILEGAVDNKKDEYIKSVYDEALRMNDIVTSLLTFNRLSATDKIEKENCNLTALVKEEVEKYIPFARSAGAELALNAEEDISVSCNPKLMALAVDNYLSNAVKYTTGEKRINVTLKTEKDSFLLEVFNTCEPLSKETTENIWNLFERQDISRTRDGSSTGMGLPICKRIFECHGYGYSCKNTDTGVVFSVRGKL